MWQKKKMLRYLSAIYNAAYFQCLSYYPYRTNFFTAFYFMCLLALLYGTDGGMEQKQMTSGTIQTVLRRVEQAQESCLQGDYNFQSTH